MSHRLFWAHRPFYFHWVFDQNIKVRKAITKLWYFQPGPNASVIFIQLSRLCRNRISVLHFITDRNGSKYWLSMIFSIKVKSGPFKREKWTYGSFNQIRPLFDSKWIVSMGQKVMKWTLLIFEPSEGDAVALGSTFIIWTCLFGVIFLGWTELFF